MKKRLLIKNKQGLLVTALLDFIGWVLLILVAILFYFIFKFTAQEANIVISSSMVNEPSFFTAYLLKSGYNDDFTVSELIINSENEKSFNSLNELINKRYGFLVPIQQYYYWSPNYWALVICDQKSLLDHPPTGSTANCFVNTMNAPYSFGGVIEKEKPITHQLPNPNKKVYVDFIYSKHRQK